MNQDPNSTQGPQDQSASLIDENQQRDGTNPTSQGGGRLQRDGERVGNDDLGDSAASPNNIAG